MASNMLAKTRTAEELQKLVDGAFELNSIFDNIAYGLTEDLHLPKFGDFVHHTLAHSFPVDYADYIQNFANARGVRIVRGVVPSHQTIYSSPITAMEEGYGALVHYETMLDNAINVCIEDGDKPTEDFLRGISSNILPYYIHQLSRFVIGLKAFDEDNLVVMFNEGYEGYLVDYFKDKN